MRKFRVTVNGNQYVVDIEEISDQSAAPPTQPAQATPAEPVVRSSDPAQHPKAQPAPAKESDGSLVMAQMPGTIIKINVNPGDQVTRGQTLLVLEAMKMENDIVAPQDGTVAEVRTSPGVSVNTGDVLVVLN